MHHSRRNKGDDRIVLPYHEGGFHFGLSWAVFPKDELELPRKEGEAVGLVGVFVGPSGDSGMGYAHVSHGWLKSFGQLVVSKKLG